MNWMKALNYVEEEEVVGYTKEEWAKCCKHCGEEETTLHDDVYLCNDDFCLYKHYGPSDADDYDSNGKFKEQ